MHNCQEGLKRLKYHPLTKNKLLSKSPSKTIRDYINQFVEDVIEVPPTYITQIMLDEGIIATNVLPLVRGYFCHTLYKKKFIYSHQVNTFEKG